MKIKPGYQAGLKKFDGRYLFLLVIAVVVLINFCLTKTAPRANNLNLLSDLLSLGMQIGIILCLRFENNLKPYLNIRFYNCLMGLLLGLAFFLLIVGLNIVNPTNINWVMSSEDPTMYFLGWNFFRYDQWRPLVGTFQNWVYPSGMTLLYTDSIPLFAILFKTIRSVLPEPFQYLGLWMAVSYALMGYASLLLMGRLSGNKIIQVLGAILFVINPVLLFRAGNHTSLTSHWLIICALLLMLSDNYTKGKIIACIALLVCSMAVHPNIFLMVLIMMCTYMATAFVDEKKTCKILSTIVLSAIACFTTLYVLGYYAVPLVQALASNWGYGSYSMNLNALFNPTMECSAILNNYVLADPGQYEGFNYLGFGVLALLLAAVVTIIYKREIKNLIAMLKRPVFWMSVALTITALSNTVSFNEHTFKYPIPEFLDYFMGIIRASGRMFWPVYYLILYYALKINIHNRLNDKTKIAILSAVIVIQCYDLSPFYVRRRTEFDAIVTWTTKLQNDFWEKAKDRYKHIALISNLVSIDSTYNYADIAYYASTAGMTLSDGHFTRFPESLWVIRDDYVKKIVEKKYPPDTLFIINASEIRKMLLKQADTKNHIAMIDGYAVFAPDQTLEKYNYTHYYQYGTVLPATPAEFNKFINFGWYVRLPFDPYLSSDGKIGFIFLPVKESTEDLKLWIEAKPRRELLNQAVQHVKIFVNNDSVGELIYALDQDTVKSVIIPRNLTINGYLAITFIFPDAQSPKSTWIVDNVREIAISIKGLSLTNTRIRQIPTQ
jgi:hypothetical protein